MFDFMEAIKIAERRIAERIAASDTWSQFSFEPVRFIPERTTEAYWLFWALSADALEAGMAPNFVSAAIDKQDGHVWTDEEFDRYYAQPVTRSQAA